MNDTDQECPICFLHYSEINMADCCKAAICTECFLQLQVPKMTHSCPFCNGENMTVKVAKRLEEEDVRMREVEEQKVIEQSIMEKFGGKENVVGGGGGGKERTSLGMMATMMAKTMSSGDDNDSAVAVAASTVVERQGSSSFGSSLEAELAESRERRSRTMSLDGRVDGETIVVMTPEERRALEEQVRSQSHHPLLRQMSLRAERERERHELEYIQRRIMMEREQEEAEEGEEERNRRMRRQPMPLEEFLGLRTSSGTGGGGSDHGTRNRNGQLSMDDWVLLETAFLWSMRDRGMVGGGRGGRRSRGEVPTTRRINNNNSNRNDGRPRSQRDAETEFLTNMIRNRDAGRQSSQRRLFDTFSSPSSLHGHPMGRHAYDYGLHLSEENQLELAIRLSLQEAQRRGDVIATNEDNMDEAVGLDGNDQQQHQSVREEETVEFEYPQSSPAQD